MVAIAMLKVIPSRICFHLPPAPRQRSPHHQDSSPLGFMMIYMLHLHKNPLCSTGAGRDILHLRLSDLMNLPIRIPMLEVQGCTFRYIHPCHLQGLSLSHLLCLTERETGKGVTGTGIGRETQEGAMEAG